MDESIKTESIKEGKSSEKAPKKKAKWKKVVGTILTVLVILLVAFCGLFVVQTKMNKKPFLFGYAVYYVVSGSMEPTIMTGEVIIVEKINGEEDLHRNDIITFVGIGGTIDGMTVTHRIVSDGVVNGKITTCGDANHGIKDNPIPYSNVIGKYVRTSSFLTSVYAAFTSKYGFLFIVFIPLVVLLVVQVLNFRRACRMDKDGKLPEEKSAEEIKEEAVKAKEDEIKRKAIEDYLASKKRLEKAAREGKKKE